MTNALLLGAGFSKNWEAPLAWDVFHSLIADAGIRGSSEVRELLFAQQENGSGFEGALDVLQRDFIRDPQRSREKLLLLQGALSRVFNDINDELRQQRFERTQDIASQVGTFLAKFDYVFTLNQDLLLEMHYYDRGMELLNPQKWGGGVSPGLEPEGRITDALYRTAGRIWRPTNPVNQVLDGRLQPYIKLHGSTNWYSEERPELMIMGGGKERDINRIPLLRWYLDLFTEVILRPDTRLTVVGYGFRDDHINRIIQSGTEQKGPFMFVMNPRGAQLAYMDRDSRAAVQAGPTPFELWFNRGLYSAATTALPALLAGNSTEKRALVRFMAGE